MKMLPFFIEKFSFSSDYPIHAHEYSQLFIITKGKAVHIINNKQFQVKEGHVYVVNENSTHGFKNAENLEMYNILYNTEELMKKAGSLKKISGFQALFLIEPFYKSQFKCKSRMILDYEGQKYVVSVLERLLREYKNKDFGFEVVFHSLFMLLVAYLSRKYTSSQNAGFDKAMKMAEAVAFLEANYTKEVCLDQLAEKACLSKRQFIRIFKENYSVTPMRYILQMKINNACYLLNNTNKTITEIALDCGFSDSNYFSRQFKKIMNVTPSQYQKNL
ncbi:helix-turn-helix domain-containing protein [Clostridium sediminicola]|uniref:AraC family transcriptional regulator n=1 Tax=Clostridium sediminicola TaxID=3114879 RepID=UPI0031F2244B